MRLQLPSSTDIFLVGVKTHPSELRLARFLLNSLQEGSIFIDVGAHCGYYTLLASELVGPNGKVFAFEAAPFTFALLHANTTRRANVTCHNLAISDAVGKLSFCEFPALYSEYNALDVSPFEKERWFARYPPRIVEVSARTLDSLFLSVPEAPVFLKIDVEGAEERVVRGARQMLVQFSPIVIVEYVSEHRGNAPHQQAEKFLNELGYSAFRIDDAGQLQPLRNVSRFLSESGEESDNLVFLKGEHAVIR